MFINLLCINKKTLETKRAANPDEADRITASDALGSDQIAWALEEYKRSDGIEWIVIPEEWEE